MVRVEPVVLIQKRDSAVDQERRGPGTMRWQIQSSRPVACGNGSTRTGLEPPATSWRAAVTRSRCSGPSITIQCETDASVCACTEQAPAQMPVTGRGGDHANQLVFQSHGGYEFSPEECGLTAVVFQILKSVFNPCSIRGLPLQVSAGAVQARSPMTILFAAARTVPLAGAGVLRNHLSPNASRSSRITASGMAETLPIACALMTLRPSIRELRAGRRRPARWSR